MKIFTGSEIRDRERELEMLTTGDCHNSQESGDSYNDRQDERAPVNQNCLGTEIFSMDWGGQIPVKSTVRPSGHLSHDALAPVMFGVGGLIALLAQ